LNISSSINNVACVVSQYRITEYRQIHDFPTALYIMQTKNKVRFIF